MKQSKLHGDSTKSNYFFPFSYDVETIDKGLINMSNSEAQAKPTRRKVIKTLGPKIIENTDNYFNYNS